MNNKILFFFFVLFVSKLTLGQTIISGISPENRSVALHAYTITDPISKARVELASDTIGNDGTFTLALNNNVTLPVYIDFGKKNLTMFVEPEKNYNIVLPRYETLSEYEKHSSFFKRKPYYPGIKSIEKEELNHAIRQFDAQLSKLIAENSTGSMRGLTQQTIKKIIVELNDKFSKSMEHNNYFNDFVYYRTVELRLLNSENSKEQLAINHFGQKQYKPNNVAYFKAFNRIFSSFLVSQSRQVHNTRLKQALYTGDRVGLENYLQNTGFSSEITPYIILKTYEEALGSKVIQSKICLSVIKSFVNHQTLEVKEQARRISNHSSKMMIGTKAPNFTAPDQNAVNKSLDYYKGKYTYFAFLKSTGGDYAKEKTLLMQMANQYVEILNVVIVFTDKMPPRTALPVGVDCIDGWRSSTFLNNYQVKNLSKYCLINDNAIILQSPAVAPSEGFSATFLRYYREKKMEEHRKQVRSGKN